MIISGLVRVLGIVGVLGFACGSLNAGVITLGAGDIIPTGYSPPNSNPGSASDILPYLQQSTLSEYQAATLSDIGSLLFKWEQGTAGDSGLLSSSYDVIDQLNSGKDGANISYGLGNIVDTASPAWLVVKGGSTGFVLYDLDNFGPSRVNWDGVMNLKFTNAGLFGPKGQLQGVSNIAIWGGSKPNDVPPPGGGPGVVPEPTTLAIWSIMGLCGVGAARRKRSKKA